MRKIYRWGVWTIWLIFAAVSAWADVPPEVVVRGKSATALVEAESGRRSGTAFCIDRAGFFITNEHVAGALGGRVSLVLYPGEKNQKVLTARVLRVDKKADLALLSAEAPPALKALELGDIDTLVETQSVIAFGFPFGKDLAVTAGEYPAVTVSTGHITSLRKAAGELREIQLDASLNPGNSGGPVVNDKGQVIGVVSMGIRGSGVNFAIPISLVRQLLSQIEIAFTPATIPPGKEHDLTAFEITLVSLLKSLKGATVELQFNAGKGDSRVFPAKSMDGRIFTVQAVPVPLRPGGSPLLLTIKNLDSEITCHVKDMPVTIGGRAYRLSQIRHIENQGGTSITLADGQRLSGRLSGLEAVETRVGGALTHLNLQDAVEVLVADPDSAAASVEYRIVVRHGGKIVAEQTGALLQTGGTVSLDPDARAEAGGVMWQPLTIGFGPTFTRNGRALEITLPANSGGSPIFMAGCRSNVALRGDFDVQVDYRLLDWPEANGMRLGMRLVDTSNGEVGSVLRSNDGGEYDVMTIFNRAGGEQHVRTIAVNRQTGRLRITRSGNRFTGYSWDEVVGKWNEIDTAGDYTGEIQIVLMAWSDDNRFAHRQGRFVFENFRVNKGVWVRP